MSILIGADSRVIVQGITGRDGSFHALSMREYGTRVVGGVTPGKGGRDVQGIPVFESVREAVAETGADTSVIFVPAFRLHRAAEGGAGAPGGLHTEGIPVQEMLANYPFRARARVRLIGLTARA
jgi:succinyl-CoA synthetase alpha subunit